MAGWVTTWVLPRVDSQKKLGTHVNRVVVVGLSRASRVFSPGSPVFLPPQNQPKLNPS